MPTRWSTRFGGLLGHVLDYAVAHDLVTDIVGSTSPANRSGIAGGDLDEHEVMVERLIELFRGPEGGATGHGVGDAVRAWHLRGVPLPRPR